MATEQREHKEPSAPATAVARDALRVLLVVRILGTPGNEGAPEIAGEARLRQLDHLIRHPATAALWLIDRVGQGGAALRPDHVRLRRACRRLATYATAGSRRLVAAGVTGPGWRPLDDAVAFLSCRRLLSVRSAAHPADDRYAVTADGIAIADGPLSGRLGDDRAHCRLLASCIELLPPGSFDDPGLGTLASHLAYFREDTQLRPEDDLTAHLFHLTFDRDL